MQEPATCFTRSHKLSPEENGNGCVRRCRCECKFDCARRVEETVGYSKSVVHSPQQLDRRQSASIYIDQQISRLLLPALEETLLAADKWNALRVQKCWFNGIDRLAEILWNRNPRRSKSIRSRVHAFDIPLFQRWLSLRPPYPKSWLWTRDEAALCLQRYVRGWLVRKRDDVQELRQFWKDFAEKDVSDKQIRDHILQHEGTSIKGASEYEPSMHIIDTLRCKAYRRAIAAKKTNCAKSKDSTYA
ncbi:IQ domain-containing protein K [Lasioglossum baleicum]|uniref:IQ domain-containing protein K n=1 Tax=Lasioglossum baleicum TaxID=434251 RepID=UPI003FCE4C92